MAQGLGKNSPVVLSLGRSNYEALIERHGQYVRWRTSRLCPCVNQMNNQPNIHCKNCGGSGYVYGYQQQYTASVRLPVIDGMLELPKEQRLCTVLRIYNYAGVSFQFIQNEQFIKLIHLPCSLTRGEFVDVVFTDSLVSTLPAATLTRICKGVYQVPNLTVPASRYEGVYYRPFCDVVQLGSLCDETGTAVAATGFRKDCVEVSLSVDVPVLYAKNIAYIKPVRFIVLSQNLQEDTLSLLHKHSGDAVCTMPYYYDVSQGDIITVLSGTCTHKQVLTKTQSADEDVLHEYFVERIKTIESIDYQFIEYKDFILTGTNRIRWISDKKPAQGQTLSITFTYNPTYRVVKHIPSLRSSEDQCIPRKVIVQLLSSFQEQSKVHQNFLF